MQTRYHQQTLIVDPELPITLDTVREMIRDGRIWDIPHGQSVEWIPEGQRRMKRGRIQIREVRCGKKNCNYCPHRAYAYLMYRDGKKVKSKYISKVNFS